MKLNRIFPKIETFSNSPFPSQPIPTKKPLNTIRFMETEIIISAVSAILIVVGAYLWQKTNYLVVNGKKAKGVIFKNVKDSNFGSENKSHYYPVVRFLTDKQEWITEKLNVGYSYAMDEGTKVEVLYDPDDPTNIVLNSTFQIVIFPRLLVAVGILGFLLGILELLGIIKLIES